MTHLNQQLGFDEVRWATMRKTSYDAGASFKDPPVKTLLPMHTRLFRLLPLAAGSYFDSSWWMPKAVFTELQNDVNRSSHGGGRLLRNYIGQYMALPVSDKQLSLAEIELIRGAYAWVGNSAPLFERPGGMQQVFLPNLADRGSPKTSANARLIRTYSLTF